MMKKLNYLGLLFMFLMLFSFKGTNNRNIEVWVLDNSKTKELIFRFKNLGSKSIYLPEKIWLNYDKDTLFLEAIYKRIDDNDPVLNYNMFMPPKLLELKSGDYLTRKINYSKLKLKFKNNVSVRFFNDILSLDPISDYEKYHSKKYYEEYEKNNSFTINLKIDKNQNIMTW